MKQFLVLPLAYAFFFEDIHNCVIGYKMGVKLRKVHDFYSLPRAAKKLLEHDISLEVCDSGLPVN